MLEPDEQSLINRITRRALLYRAGGAISAAVFNLSLPGEAYGLNQKRGDAKTEEQKNTEAKKNEAQKKEEAAAVFLSGNNLYRDLITYYNLGNHRTATDVDIKTTYWIARQLRGVGFQLKIQPFSLRQFFVRQTRLIVAGKQVRSFPMWPPRATGPNGIRAPLAAFNKGTPANSLRGRIAVVKFPFDARAAVFNGSVHSELIAAAARAGALAVVAITEGPTGELIALNSTAEASASPVPVVLSRPRDEAVFAQAIEQGTEAHLLVDGTNDPKAEAKNVVGKLERGRDWIVISTPQSGWFRCAAERGPGIALFLALARWASKRQSPTSFLFVSTSGHELGGLGMKSFLNTYAPPPGQVLCWLHLGAGIATWKWEQGTEGMKRLNQVDANRYLMSTDDLAPLLTDAFAGLPGLAPDTHRAVGEYELIRKAGYRAFGIAAAHTFHHTPADSPEMTAPELLEPVAKAITRALEAIEAKARA